MSPFAAATHAAAGVVWVWDTALLGPSSLPAFASGADVSQPADSGAAAAADGAAAEVKSHCSTPTSIHD